MRKLALYLHIPFCKQKCKYCDFTSFCINGETKIEKYVEAICEQVKYYALKSKDFEVTSIYFGGGTPSFIDVRYIKEILRVISENYSIIENPEITLEANPGTVDFKKLKKYKELNINRISFGVQTLNDELLKEIGRIHTAKEAIETFNLARDAGFNNISLDIIFGLPNQTLKDIEDTLDEFIKLSPEHISTYSLKIEENTVFGRLYKEHKLKLPSEELEREMYYTIKEKLKKAGYIQYEISNFAKAGYYSRHNTSYWERQDYLGFGVSAASCFNEVRFTNTEDFESYIGNPINNFSENEMLTKDVIDSEKIILGLRMLKGVDEDLFFKDEWKESLQKLINKGLLKREGENISLTDKGLDLANQVFVEFI